MKMFDAAYLPNPVPAGYDVAAGYAYQTHGEAAHLWTAADWKRAAQSCRYLLPIATCWTPFGTAATDADNLIRNWQVIEAALGLSQRPCALALDVELRIATAPGCNAYVAAWRDQIRHRGFHDIVYSSYSGARNLGTGGLWLGPPAHPGQTLTNGVVEIAQTEYLGDFDVDVTLPGVPFFDTRPADPPAKVGGTADVPADKDFVGSFSNFLGAWKLQYDGGVDTIRGPFLGSYFSLPAAVRNDPARRFTSICAAVDGGEGYSIVSVTGEPYTFNPKGIPTP